MLSIFVLVVSSHVYGGTQVTFQEFNSLRQCEHVAAYVKKEYNINYAVCFAK